MKYNLNLNNSFSVYQIWLWREESERLHAANHEHFELGEQWQLASNAFNSIIFKLYFPLNIRITLVHSEIWKKGDQISVIPDSKETLNNFMEYKKIMLKDHFFDTGYLMTWVFLYKKKAIENVIISEL